MAHRDIVVIGASAGGVEALMKLVAALPASLPAALFIVLHIPPDTPTRLHDILGKVSTLPVELARDEAPIVPGRVVVAAPDRHLIIEQDRIRLARGPKENRARPAIDVLFRSAAYHFGPRVIGIVLSGNLDDGTAGLWTVKDRGGVAMVQSPEEAYYSSMPQSAINHVAVDHVLPVERMPPLLSSLSLEDHPARQVPARGNAMQTEIDIAGGGNALLRGTMQLGTISTNTCPACHGVLVRIDEGPIVRYRCHTGHAYSVQTLLAHLDEEVDGTLVAALRTLNERIMLLQQMQQQASAAGHQAHAEELAQKIKASRKWAQQLRTIASGNGGKPKAPPEDSTGGAPEA